jgi:hypothetical protein
MVVYVIVSPVSGQELVQLKLPALSAKVHNPHIDVSQFSIYHRLKFDSITLTEQWYKIFKKD